ncbi:protein MOTHER of FT and TFL1 homolog 1 isoform X3 [Triticum aestivum]|uniref:protein MOTHER of FT and TFL1 homolog 1 isoform X3 n=1 Tax=Triticum aestivum TaxID=4565 RepID=UPI001D0257F2|nr:protein MOTHER of FT and TFL1 homolog 1-like isoform X3 [Triticum aestivum]
MVGSGMHAQRGDPLVVGRVIGDVVDPFVRRVALRVGYASRDVANGCELRPSAIADPPRVEVGGPDMRTFYTLAGHRHPGDDRSVFCDRGGVLRGPAAGARDPPAGVPALPAAGPPDGVRPGVAAELQHPRLRRALQPRPARRRRLLQLPEGDRDRREKDVMINTTTVVYVQKMMMMRSIVWAIYTGRNGESIVMLKK